MEPGSSDCHEAVGVGAGWLAGADGLLRAAVPCAGAACGDEEEGVMRCGAAEGPGAESPPSSLSAMTSGFSPRAVAFPCEPGSCGALLSAASRGAFGP